MTARTPGVALSPGLATTAAVSAMGRPEHEQAPERVSAEGSSVAADVALFAAGSLRSAFTDVAQAFERSSGKKMS